MDLESSGDLEEPPSVHTSDKNDDSDFDLQDIYEPNDTNISDPDTVFDASNSSVSDVASSVDSKMAAIKENISEELSSVDDVNNISGCEPCQNRGQTKQATKMCQKCDERYCEECSINHSVQKQTKQHLLQDFVIPPPTPKVKMCEPCALKKKDQTATLRCENCDELLCTLCKDFHLSQKINKNHVIKLLSLMNCDDSTVVETSFSVDCVCRDSDNPDTLCLACADNHTTMNIKDQKSFEMDQHKTIPAASETNVIEGATSRPEVNIDIFCEPCEFQEKQIRAHECCIDCEEKYCEECSRRHKKHPKTMHHKLLDLKSLMSPEHICDVCAFDQKDMIADGFCPICDEYLCTECKNHHRAQKRNRGHVIEPVNSYPACQSCLSVDVNERGTSYCIDCEEPEMLCNPCATRHVSMKQTRSHKISEDLMSFKLRAMKVMEERIQQTGNQGNLNPNCPGKPYVIETPKSNMVKVRWDEFKLIENETYQVMFKEFQGGEWKIYRETAQKGMMKVDGLKPQTQYIFRVRKINRMEGSEGVFSDESDVITTSESPAVAVMKMSQMVDDKPIPVFALPLKEIEGARNSSARTRKLCLGEYNRSPTEKNVMIVGATGSGKSTLINAMANYIMGVTWEDPFRFTLVDVETEEKEQRGNQAVSQTQWITSYTIYSTASSRLPFNVNLIDTPGFGDTRGIEYDQKIIKQIKELFCSTGSQGIATIDAICFILKAPDARLTPTQSYIFESILSLFGKDIKDNICTLITFADGQKPPVLSCLEALEHKMLPFDQFFIFNNSALYADNSIKSSSNFNSSFFWEMGMRSCKDFFDHLKSLRSKSLVLTAEVLNQREELEDTVEHLQNEIDNGLSKINVLEQEIEIFTKCKRAIRENKDFHYSVIEEIQEKIDLTGTGRHTTTCLTCNYTCHERCIYANDDDKAKCSAMQRSGKCKRCPGNCHWMQHKNTSYILRLVPVQKWKKYSEKQKIYEEESKKKMNHKQILKAMNNDIELLEIAIAERMERITECNNRLREIALRPDPLTAVEYLNLMIEGEKREKKSGFQKRIEILSNIRKKAEFGNEVSIFRDRVQLTRQTLFITIYQPDDEAASSTGVLEGMKNLGKKIINKMKI